MKIRTAERNDLQKIVEIYNQAVLAGNATADLSPITLEDRTQWFDEHSYHQYPLYIIEQDYGAIVGWVP